MTTTTRRPASRPAPVGAEDVILGLLATLYGQDGQGAGLMNQIIDGERHAPKCGRHQWINPNSPRPDGDPCLRRCAQARAAIESAAVWLRAHAQPAQPSLLGLMEGTG